MALHKREAYDKDDQQASAARRTRITFDVNPNLRRRIKMAANQQDRSISEYLNELLEQTVPSEAAMVHRKRPATRKMLEELNQISETILREHGGKPFEDSTELIREMREERLRQLEDL